MPITYPAPAPTITGDYETISRFLQSPTLITRAMRPIALNRYISDSILSRRFVAQGGAVMYEQNKPQFNQRDPQPIAPLGSYPKTLAQLGPALIAAVQKWGQDEPVSDEAIKYLNFDPVMTAMTMSVNTNVRFIDSMTLGAISSQISQEQDAAAPWDGSAATPTILRDVLKAKAQIVKLNQGYDPDTLVVDDDTYAIVASDPVITNAMRREVTNTPIYQGVDGFPVIAGLRVLPTSNSPTPGVPLVLDSKVLGGMADEDLGGPGYTGQIKGIQAKAIRMTGNDDRDGWWIRCRRVTVPVIIEPNAAIKITGTAA